MVNDWYSKRFVCSCCKRGTQGNVVREQVSQAQFYAGHEVQRESCSRVDPIGRTLGVCRVHSICVLGLRCHPLWLEPTMDPPMPLLMACDFKCNPRNLPVISVGVKDNEINRVRTLPLG